MPDLSTATRDTVDFDSLGVYERYKLMASLIVPRPIALVTTVSASGVANAAPFSMFAMVGEDPPMVMISIDRLPGGSSKDTSANIDATGELVVHLVDRPVAARMHACGERVAPEVDELALVGLTAVPASRVAAPLIVEAPIAFECTLEERMETASRLVYFARIRVLHARAGLIDRDRWRVRLQRYSPIGRFGASFYTTTAERFSLAIDDAGDARLSTEIDEI